MNAVREKALSLVGQGYIYGAKGQKCSPAFRQQQAAQYPEYADNILNTGAKWDGKPVWDCAQLTRSAAKEAGVSLPSGATSQWKKSPWKRQGEIDTLPSGEVCFLYRRQKGSETVMSHTGVALGDGWAVHARSTAYGVIHQKIADFGWTHWASPWDAGEKEEEPMAVLFKAEVTAESGSTVRVRTAPDGLIIEELKIGTVVDVLEELGEWMHIRFNGGMNGYMMSKFLKKTDEARMVSIELTSEVAKALLEALQKTL